MIGRTHHSHNLWVCGLCEDASSGGDVVDELVESRPLDFFALQVRHRVHEVEHSPALLQLLNEEGLLFVGGRVCGNDIGREKRGKELKGNV